MSSFAARLPALRDRFPGLARQVGGRPAVFFDGPAGSQVPTSVIDAMVHYLAHTNANSHGGFATSDASDAVVAAAHAAVARLLGAPHPDEVIFGANMTTLTFALSRAIGRTWGPGDEVVVTRSDHDANVWPWVLAARDAGATVRWADIRPDTTLDLETLPLGPRTRLVAVGAAANAVGTVQPVAEVTRRAHAVGAEVFVDAVHYAPHRKVDVAAWGCDWVVCSAYKFFGPHVGIAWGRRERLAELEAYRVRPPGEVLPGKWMTGTANFEGIAGTLAAVRYLEEIGYDAIEAWELQLGEHLLDVLHEVPGLRLHGIDGLEGRVPTFAVTHPGIRSPELAAGLAARGIFVWSGDMYARECIARLGLQPDGVVRIGALHYNTLQEVERLGRALHELCP